METSVPDGVALAPLFPAYPLWSCTSLARLKKAGACAEGYRRFARFLKEQWPMVGEDDPVPLLLALLNSNDQDDVLWAFRYATCEPADRQQRELACDFAEHVLPIFEQRHPQDARPRMAIQVSRSFARGEASALDLQGARRAAAAAAAAAAAYAAAAYAADAYAAAAYAADAYAADAAAAYAAAAYAADAYAAAAYAADAAADAADAAADAAAADAAASAAYAAARRQARADERKWQRERLAEVLLHVGGGDQVGEGIGHE